MAWSFALSFYIFIVQKKKKRMQTVGIDDMALAIPSLYLPIRTLATARDIEPAKLEKGLGLLNMALCDVDEDVITLGARAAIELIDRNDINPDQIGRIYVGTESSQDGSKPIASYIHGIVKQYYDAKSVDASPMSNCDVVDLTFACIGAVDAMHNCLAWMQTPMAKGKVAIVIATDDAKYDLASSGEYTQGAGAVAILLKPNPRLLDIDLNIGVGMSDEHDFFKPVRKKIDRDASPFTSPIVNEHSDTPVFDGPFSNQTYGNRIIEAWDNYQAVSGDQRDLSAYSRYIFHLPYAYHGRRILPQLFFDDLAKRDQYQSHLAKYGLSEPQKEGIDSDAFKQAKRTFLKARTKTPFFGQMISHKVESTERLSSQIGNVYTASIFIALMSALYLDPNASLDNKELLFIGYGSGSKSKVFKGVVKPGWQNVASQWSIQTQFKSRKEITFDQYLSLRCHSCPSPLSEAKHIHQVASGSLDTNRFARFYKLEN